LDEAHDNEAFLVNEVAFAISMPEFLHIRRCSHQLLSPGVAINEAIAYFVEPEHISFDIHIEVVDDYESMGHSLRMTIGQQARVNGGLPIHRYLHEEDVRRRTYRSLTTARLTCISMNNKHDFAAEEEECRLGCCCCALLGIAVGRLAQVIDFGLPVAT